jgi:hypothetical protein
MTISPKYEKPLIIPFDTDKDETGLGQNCVSGGPFASQGKCQPTGNSAVVDCKTGNSFGS